ncbi:MAG: hypothetical protein F4114_05350 [Rhodospirillaceae bacterium]|nr:hypothetical protein [Rhodospirillaceae bacterium]MYI48498.1 hypothetical protein [Rhodospirillaceae bacterium]
MQKTLSLILAALILLSSYSIPKASDGAKQTMPHKKDCAVKLPENFWSASGAAEFRDAETWAWNKICIGNPANMRFAAKAGYDNKECKPAEIERKKEKVPNHRILRPEFIELVLSHDPWASVARHPRVIIQCALVKGNITLANHDISPSFFFINGKIEGYIMLINAQFKRSLSFQGTTVTKILNADRLEVRGSLFLRNGGSFGRINLLGAKIGTSLQFGGSTFSNRINLTGATIGGELNLLEGGREGTPIWRSKARLILRNARAGALHASMSNWNMSKNGKFLPTELTGFVYTRLGGMDEPGSRFMGDASADWLTDRIEAQLDHGKFYDPQPYTQLASVLDAAGATEKAKAILYAKFEHKRVSDKTISPARRAALWLEKWIIGYGLFPFHVLYWFFGLVAVGGVLAQFSKEPSVRGLIGLWYSLENALPLIETSENFKNTSHGFWWLSHYFHFQKLVGFVLATVLVGALTLLSG